MSYGIWILLESRLPDKQSVVALEVILLQVSLQL